MLEGPLEREPDQYVRKHPQDKHESWVQQVKVLHCPKPERPKTPEKVVVIPPPPEQILQGPLEGEAAPAPPQLEMVIGLPELDTSGHLPLGRFSRRHQGNRVALPTAQVARPPSLLVCARLATPSPPPPPTAPAPPLPDNAQGLCGGGASEVIVSEGSDKWSWLKEDDRSVGFARHKLTMFW